MSDAAPAPAAPANGTTTPAGKQAVPPVNKGPAAGPIVERKGTPAPEGGEGRSPDGSHAKPATPPKPAAKPPEPSKKIRLKLGEAEEEFDSPEELARVLARERAQARSLQRQRDTVEARERALSEAGDDPIKVMKARNPNFDVDAWVLAKVKADLEAEELAPEQKAIRERDEKIAGYEREKQERQEAEAQAAREKLQKAENERYERMMIEALEATAEEGDDEDYRQTVLLRDVASVYLNIRQQLRAMKQADPDLDTSTLEYTPAEVAKIVRKQHARSFERGLTKAPVDKVLPVALKSLTGLPDGVLLAKLGKDMVARIVKAHVAATDPMRAPPPELPSAAPVAEAPPAWQSRPTGVLGPQGESAIPEKRTIPRF